MRGALIVSLLCDVYSFPWGIMATFDTSKTLTQCPVCLQIDEHVIGDYKTRQDENGYLFDAALPDAVALKKTSIKFDEHALMKCDGSITHDCLEGFVQLELLTPDSPLSKLFSKRIRAMKCPHCGYLTELSRLP